MDAHWVLQVQDGPTRVNHCSVFYKGDLIIFGGYCAHLYVIESDEPEERDEHSLIPLTVDYFNIARLSWSRRDSSMYDYGENGFDWNHLPMNRYGHSVVHYKNEVYLWGGSNEHLMCHKLFVYNLDTRKWRAVEVAGMFQPSPRDGHTAVLHEDSFYVFGGFEALSQMLTNETLRFHIPTRNWSIVKTPADSPRPLPRDFHSAHVVGSRMYIVGGRGEVPDPNGRMEQHWDIYPGGIWYLDLLRCQWHEVHPVTGIPPVPRRSHAGFVHNGCIYISGGFNSSLHYVEGELIPSSDPTNCAGIHFMDMYQFDTVRNRWTKLSVGGEGPCIRRRHTMTPTIGDEVILFGGTTPCDEADRDQHADNLTEMGDVHVLTLNPNLEFLSMRSLLKSGAHILGDSDSTFGSKLRCQCHWQNPRRRAADVLPNLLIKEVERIYRKPSFRNRSNVHFA